MSGFQPDWQGTNSPRLVSTGAAVRTESNGSNMTEPDTNPASRTEHLESIVDDLGDMIAAEREAEGVAGKPSDRAQAPVRGSEVEPPV